MSSPRVNQTLTRLHKPLMGHKPLHGLQLWHKKLPYVMESQLYGTRAALQSMLQGACMYIQLSIFKNVTVDAWLRTFKQCENSNVGPGDPAPGLLMLRLGSHAGAAVWKHVIKQQTYLYHKEGVQGSSVNKHLPRIHSSF